MDFLTVLALLNVMRTDEEEEMRVRLEGGECSFGGSCVVQNSCTAADCIKPAAHGSKLCLWHAKIKCLSHTYYKKLHGNDSKLSDVICLRLLHGVFLFRSMDHGHAKYIANRIPYDFTSVIWNIRTEVDLNTLGPLERSDLEIKIRHGLTFMIERNIYFSESHYCLGTYGCITYSALFGMLLVSVGCKNSKILEVILKDHIDRRLLVVNEPQPPSSCPH